MSDVPPWGCPWHGLVKGGQLQLPSGESMAFPQPSGFWYAQGQARLVAHPLAPEDARSPGQVEADEELGRQWRRQAVLAGGNGALHGRALGNGRWLYIDPSGDVWLAETTLSQGVAAAASGSIEVFLRRFGVLGGREEEHSYAVPVADVQLGQSEPALSLVSHGIALCDTKADGSSALFCIHALPSVGERYTFPFMPLGWVELSLSGAGSDCEIVLDIVTTRDQALGNRIHEDSMSEGQEFTYSTPPESDREEVAVFVYPYLQASRRSVIGRTLAMFYGQDGELKTLTMSVDSTTSAEQVTGGVDFGPDAYAGEFRWDSQITLDVVLMLDEEVTHSTSYTTTQTAITGIASVGSPYAYFARYDQTGSRTTTYTDGSVFQEGPYVDNQESIGIVTVQPQVLPPLLDATDPSAALLAVDGVLFPVAYAAGEVRTARILPAMHSLLLYSLAESLSAAGTRKFSEVCVTPAGPRSAPPLEIGSPTARAYGSWCPITDSLQRDTAPICYV